MKMGPFAVHSLRPFWAHVLSYLQAAPRRSEKGAGQSGQSPIYGGGLAQQLGLSWELANGEHGCAVNYLLATGQCG